MTSSKELFDDLLKDTLTFLAEHHRDDERIVFDKKVLIEEITPPPVKRTEAPSPPIKRLTPLPPPPVKEKKPEPAPQPPSKPSVSTKEPLNLKGTFLELAPNLFTKEATPNDSVAQKKRFAWKEKSLATEVTLLSFESHSRAHLFLQNLACALDVRLRPAKIALATLLEKENRWELFFESSSLKHLIAFPIPFEKYPNLRSYYKENPQAQQKFLHKTPLFLLRPFSDYQTDPLLKKKLWSTLCMQLSS